MRVTFWEQKRFLPAGFQIFLSSRSDFFGEAFFSRAYSSDGLGNQPPTWSALKVVAPVLFIGSMGLKDGCLHRMAAKKPGTLNNLVFYSLFQLDDSNVVHKHIAFFTKHQLRYGCLGNQECILSR